MEPQPLELGLCPLPSWGERPEAPAAPSVPGGVCGRHSRGSGRFCAPRPGRPRLLRSTRGAGPRPEGDGQPRGQLPHGTEGKLRPRGQGWPRKTTEGARMTSGPGLGRPLPHSAYTFCSRRLHGIPRPRPLITCPAAPTMTPHAPALHAWCPPAPSPTPSSARISPSPPQAFPRRSLLLALLIPFPQGLWLEGEEPALAGLRGTEGLRPWDGLSPGGAGVGPAGEGGLHGRNGRGVREGRLPRHRVTEGHSTGDSQVLRGRGERRETITEFKENLTFVLNRIQPSSFYLKQYHLSPFKRFNRLDFSPQNLSPDILDVFTHCPSPPSAL